MIVEAKINSKIDDFIPRNTVVTNSVTLESERMENSTKQGAKDGQV